MEILYNVMCYVIVFYIYGVLTACFFVSAVKSSVMSVFHSNKCGKNSFLGRR